MSSAHVDPAESQDFPNSQIKYCVPGILSIQQTTIGTDVKSLQPDGVAQYLPFSVQKRATSFEQVSCAWSVQQAHLAIQNAENSSRREVYRKHRFHALDGFNWAFQRSTWAPLLLPEVLGAKPQECNSGSPQAVPRLLLFPLFEQIHPLLTIEVLLRLVVLIGFQFFHGRRG